MHQGSYVKMKDFVEKYLDKYEDKKIKILDLGSQDVNGTYKSLLNNANWEYFGCDMAEGKNVDIVLKDIYNWSEIESQTFDVVISGQAFEHVEYFWITILEIVRVLKEGGLCCIIAPSNGVEHRYPVDCWRYYPDGFRALAKYAGLEVLEVYTQWEDINYSDESGYWKDSVLVGGKPLMTESEKQVFAYKNFLAKLIAEDSMLTDIQNIEIRVSNKTYSLYKDSKNE